MTPVLPPIPEYLIPIIALIVVPLAGWLSDDRLPRWFNAIISAIIVVIFAFLCAYLTHSFSGDLVVGFISVAGFSYVLIIGPFASLHKWLVLSVPSPLGVFAPAHVADRATIQTPATQFKPPIPPREDG